MGWKLVLFTEITVDCCHCSGVSQYFPQLINLLEQKANIMKVGLLLLKAMTTIREKNLPSLYKELTISTFAMQVKEIAGFVENVEKQHKRHDHIFNNLSPAHIIISTPAVSLPSKCQLLLSSLI